MAATDLTIKHNLFAGEKASLELVNTKERKKQRKELQKLAAVLKELESEVAQAKSDGATQVDMRKTESANGSSQGPGRNSLGEQMAAMVEALQMLQVEMAKYGYEKSSLDNVISKANLKMLTDNLDKIKNQIYKTEHESAWKRFLGTALKVLGWVVAACTSLFALATGNIPLLVATVVITVLTQTPLLKDAINLMGDALTKMGVSKKVVDVIKSIESIAIILAVIIVSVISGNEAQEGEEVGELGEELKDLGEDVEGIEEGSECAEGSESKSSFSNPFKRFSLGTNLGIMNGFASLTGSNFVDNLMDTIADFDTNMSDEEKKKMEMYLSLGVQILSLIATLGSGTAAFSQLSEIGGRVINEVKDVEEDASQFAKFTTLLKSAVNTPSAFKTFAKVTNITLWAQTLAGLGKGSLEIYQGAEQMKLQKLQAATTLIEASLNMINETTREDVQMNQRLMKQQKVGNQASTKLAAGQNEIGTQLLNASQA